LLTDYFHLRKQLVQSEHQQQYNHHEQVLLSGEQTDPEWVITTGSTIYFMLSDQIDSTSFITNSSGGWVGSDRYKPWGGLRQSSGTIPTT
jgi:hypothetical protein